MNQHKRVEIEKRILSRVVKDALRAGYTVSLYDGGEWTVRRSTSYRAVMAAAFSVDIDTLRFRLPDGTNVGWVMFVYGNCGFDVISDYADNEAMNALLAGANALADKLELQAA